jgi:hypothetical protein
MVLLLMCLMPLASFIGVLTHGGDFYMSIMVGAMTSFIFAMVYVFMDVVRLIYAGKPVFYSVGYWWTTDSLRKRRKSLSQF